MTHQEKVRETLSAALRAPVDELHEILGEMDRARGLILRKLAQPQEEDRLVPIDEASRLMGIGVSTLYRHRDRYPFAVRVAGRVRFSRNGIRRWVEARGGAA